MFQSFSYLILKIENFNLFMHLIILACLFVKVILMERYMNNTDIDYKNLYIYEISLYSFLTVLFVFFYCFKFNDFDLKNLMT